MKESVWEDSRNRIKLMGKIIRNTAPSMLSKKRKNKLTRIMIGKAMGLTKVKRADKPFSLGHRPFASN